MNIGVYAHLQTSTFFRDTIATSCCLYWLTACDRSIFMMSLPHNYIESGQTFFKIVLRSGKISSSVFFSRAIQGLNPEWSLLQKTLAGWHRLPNTIPNTWHWLLLFGRWVPASCYRSESFPILQGHHEQNISPTCTTNVSLLITLNNAEWRNWYKCPISPVESIDKPTT